MLEIALFLYEDIAALDTGSLEKADPQTRQRATEVPTRGVEQPVGR